jgi:hypothetical protein
LKNMKRQRGVTYTMFIVTVSLLNITGQALSPIGQSTDYVGSFSSDLVCKTEKERLEAEDKANPAPANALVLIQKQRQCMRRT